MDQLQALGASHRQDLDSNWLLMLSPVDKIATPEQLDCDVPWLDAVVPGTAAMAVAAESWQGGNFHDQDCWYKTRFKSSLATENERKLLVFEGLATLAQVWLNQELILESQNMHLTYEVDVGDLLKSENELVIAFRALNPVLAKRRPRPKWKTVFLEQQNLRFIRTSPIDKVQTWSPEPKLVGPWRPVSLLCEQGIAIRELNYWGHWQAGCAYLDIELQLEDLGAGLENLQLELGEKCYELEFQANENGFACSEQVELSHLEPWWPHTQAEPKLYAAVLIAKTHSGVKRFELNAVGFKQVELTLGSNTHFAINQEPLFCRGSVWSLEDYKACGGTAESLRQTLTWVKRAGFNMLRVAGTMIYESQNFYRLCDELGIMVWQDFMFSHFDYPDDQGFADLVALEVKQQLQRLSNHACIVAWCGASDTEQTAAMMGLGEEHWQSPIFAEQIAGLCQRYSPQVPYLRNSPIGGDFPFSLQQGVAHYWGVGAFRQPLSDLHKTPMPFAAECLGFSHIPEADAMQAWLGEGATFPSSNWKRGVPRDGGCSWDFDDVRDYYLEQLYRLDAYRLRSYEPERYLEISRRVPGDVMAACFNEWRQSDNICSGALTWFLKDLWPSAGYGLIDSLGQPKASYYTLARACQPLSVNVADRGMDGLQASLSNDRLSALEGVLQVSLLTREGLVLITAEQVFELAANSQQRVSLDAVLGQFWDTNYQHRFGPAKHQLVACQLLTQGELVSESYYYPLGWDLGINPNADLQSEVLEFDDYYQLTLTAESLLQSVRIEIKGAVALDNYFNLLPGQSKVIKIIKQAQTKRFRGFASALNMGQEVKLKLS